MNRVNVDLRGKGLSGEETQNRSVWRQLVRNIAPIEVGKKRWKIVFSQSMTNILEYLTKIRFENVNEH